MRNAYHVSNNKSANNQLLRGKQDLWPPRVDVKFAALLSLGMLESLFNYIVYFFLALHNALVF